MFENIIKKLAKNNIELAKAKHEYKESYAKVKEIEEQQTQLYKYLLEKVHDNGGNTELIKILEEDGSDE